MTNIVMLTHGRERLTKQTIDTLLANTKPGEFALEEYNDAGSLGTGAARNEAIGRSETLVDTKESALRGQYLYICDNDTVFLPNWLPTLIESYEWARATHNVIAMGAYNHPYHQPVTRWPFYSTVLGKTIEIAQVEALATQSWLWRWEDWDQFGPFIETSPGEVCQGDDTDMGNRIVSAGGKLATLIPPMVCNCGLTNTRGRKIPGWELVEKEYLPKGAFRA